MRKNMLLIGGMGVVGKAMISESLKRNFEITVIGLKKDKSINERVKQIIVDRKNKRKFKQIMNKISKNKWDIIFDITPFGKKDAKQTYSIFKSKCEHFFIMSTVLVYDRSKRNKKPISSSHDLSKKGKLGGYVDHKLEVEQFWRKIKNVNWTILRPYHIIGPSDSLLGCLPDHNRDPKLLERIKNNKPIILCNGGNIKFNFIDARDIARVLLKSSNNPKTFHKSYNLVNPKIITGKNYYKLIGKLLRKKVIIKNKPIKEVWKENKGWQLTTLPNIYAIDQLKKDIGYSPKFQLKRSLKDAIKSHKQIKLPLSKIPVHQRMTLLPRPRKIRWLVNS